MPTTKSGPWLTGAEAWREFCPELWLSIVMSTAVVMRWLAPARKYSSDCCSLAPDHTWSRSNLVRGRPCELRRRDHPPGAEFSVPVRLHYLTQREAPTVRLPRCRASRPYARQL